jgi:hypothetical protein
VAQGVRAVLDKPFAWTFTGGLIFKPHGFIHADWFNRETNETHENSWQLFLDKPFCQAQGQNLKRDRLQNKPSIVKSGITAHVTMKIIVFCLFVTFAASLGKIQAADESRQSQSDAEIRQKIVGTWLIDYGTTNQTWSAKCSITYALDGCYVAKATITDEGSIHEEKHEGMWRVDSAWLTCTVTNAVGVKGGPGKFFAHDKIVRVDDHELICLSGTNSAHRIFTSRYKRSK